MSIFLPMQLGTEGSENMQAEQSIERKAQGRGTGALGNEMQQNPYWDEEPPESES